MKILIKILLMGLILGATLGAKDVATITGLNGQAFIERNGSNIEIKTGDKLQEKDKVITDSKAKVQIVFEDETVVTVGKNSIFSIKEYLFEENQAPIAKFGMIKGAMRTITGRIGKIAPDKFSVVTKTTTIGIRGTNFSVVIGEDYSHNIYCTYGAISVEFDGTEYIVKQGFYITISANGKVEIREFKPQDLKKMKEKNFGKSVAKVGVANDEGLLDNIKDDYSNVAIKKIGLLIEDGTHNADTPNSAIAGYSMSNAQYSGTYETTYNNSASFSSNGTADLDVDFGNESAILTLSGQQGVTSGQQGVTSGQQVAIYNMSNVNSSSFSGVQSSSIGSADGRFNGASGRLVSGSFSYGEYTSPFDEITSRGTYNVLTSQTLD